MTYSFSFTRWFFALPLCALLFIAHAGAQPLPDRAPFTGRVTDAEGRPLGGAAITLRRQNDGGALAFWGGVIATDARGEFAFPDAEAGPYYLSVEANGFAPIQNQAVEVGAATVVGPFRLLALASFPVRVTAPDGSEVKAGRLAIAVRSTDGRSNQPRLMRGTLKDGTARFNGVLPGKAELTAVVPGVGSVLLPSVELAPGSTDTPLPLKLTAGGTLRVVTRAKQQAAAPGKGEALGGVRISFRRRGSGGDDTPRQVPAAEMMLYSPSRNSFVTRDGDGVYEVENLIPGTYQVGVAVPGSEDVAPRTQNVEAGKTAVMEHELEVTNAGTLEVTLQDEKGNPVPGGLHSFNLVSVSPSAAAITAPGLVISAGVRMERSAETDVNGRAVLFPLPRGQWQITAVSPAGQGRRRSSAMKPVTVQDQVASVTLVIPPK